MIIPAKIGPTFGAELIAAGLVNGIMWTADGVTIPDDFPDAARAALRGVIAAHDPSRAAPDTDVVVIDAITIYRRMTDAEFNAMGAGVATQSARIQGIFNKAVTFRSDAPEWDLLNTMAVKLYGRERAAELLKP
jgi:hypothetical protein